MKHNKKKCVLFVHAHEVIKNMRRVARLLGIILLIPILLGVMVVALIYVPPVQTFLRTEAIGYATEATGMDIEIKQIRLSFPLKLIVAGVTVAEKGDTLLEAERLDVQVRLLPLLQKQVDVDRVSLKNMRINTADLLEGMHIEGYVGGVYLRSHGIMLDEEKALINRVDIKNTNLKVVLNEQDEAAVDTTAATPLNWKVGLENITLSNVAMALQMPADTLGVQATIHEASFTDAQLDLGEQYYGLGQLKLGDSSFNYDSGNQPLAKQGLDPSHIRISGLNITLDSLRYKGKELGVLFTDLSLVERSGIEVSSLKGAVVANDSCINVSGLSLVTPHSSAVLDAQVDWSLIETGEVGELSVNLFAGVGKQDIKLFSPELPQAFWQQYPARPLSLSANLSGDLQQLYVNKLKAELPGALYVTADGDAQAVMDSLNRAATLRLDVETGDLSFVLALSDSINKGQFAIPEQIKLKGVGELKGSAMKANFLLIEGMGSITLDAALDSEQETYQAQLTIDSLQLNHFMPADSLYSLSLTADVEGRGTDLFSPKTSLSANVKVDQFQYAAYDISNVVLNAGLERSKANVVLAAQNELVDCRANLNALLQRSAVEADLIVNAQSINLHNLEMTDVPLDLAFTLSMQATSDMKRKHSLGATIDGMQIRTRKEDYHPKEISLTANTTPDTTVVRIEAGDLLLWVRGVGDLEDLTGQAAKLGETLMAQMESKRLDQEALKAVMPQLAVRLVAGRENPAVHFLNTHKLGFERAFFKLDMSAEEGLQSDARLFAFHTDSLQLDTIRLGIHQGEEAISLKAGVANNSANKQITFSAGIDGEVKENKAQLMFRYFDDEGKLGVELGLDAAMRKRGIHIKFLPEEPTFVYKPYQLNKDNYLFLGADKRVRANVSFLDNNQSGLRLYSIPADTTVLQDIAVELRRINLGDLKNVIPYMPEIAGLVSMEAHYVQKENELQLALDSRVNGFAYQGNRMEDIQLEAVYLPGDNGDHHMDAILSYAGNETLGLGGVYHTAGTGSLEAEASLADLPLNIANFFIPDGMAKLTGAMNGTLNIKGQLNKPTIEGELAFDSTSVLLPLYGLNFHFDERPLLIKKNKLHFNNFSIYTRSANPFSVNGLVDFTDLADMKADIKLATSDYELLNAKRTKESLLYGKVIADLNTTVKGPLNALVIRGGVKVQGGTDVTYVLADSPLVAQDRLGEMVTFVDFSDTTQVVRDTSPQVELGGMDMLVTISVDPAAQVRVDLAPDQSSYVELEGGGDLSMQYTDLDGLQLSGRYTLITGKMKYTLIPFLSREFVIENGSYVDWVGNPMNPTLNIVAVNRARATVTQNDVSRYVNFNASLTIKNQLENLQLLFALDAPEDGGIRSELSAMSEEELSKQAVAMMITGSYMGPSGGGNMNNNALNALLQGAIQGVAGSALKTIDITLGVENSGNDANPTTDYSFTFAKRFWNNRINVVIGGKVTTGDAAQANRQSFIDNVAIEYRLDNSGTRYVKLFHDINYDSILDGEIAETGVGAVLRKKMSRLKELFIFRKKKKTTPVNDETSSVY